MKVYKSSKMFFFRPDVLSLSLGIVGAIFVLLLTLAALVDGTIATVAKPFDTICPGYQFTWLGLIVGPLWGFFYGYLLGFLIGYFSVVLMRRKIANLGEEIFKFDPQEKVNIIKSGQGDSPYTIAIVANPILLDHDGLSPQQDPIMENDDPKLFLKVVVRILRSFANDDLMRLPEIFEKIRFVTIFDPIEDLNNNSYALCKAFQKFPDDVLDARTNESIAFVKQRLQQCNCAEDVDVIFIVSGSTTHFRSSSCFSEESTPGDSPRGDVRFELKTNSTAYERFHCCRSDKPGVVALSAWDDRLKTPLHEFAHAMSSKENGVIVDEYIDQMPVDLPFVVNQQHRAVPNAAIPKHFAQYRLYRHKSGKDIPEPEVEYFSDRNRCDKRADEAEPEGWTSYVPARRDVDLSCIMDIAYSGYRFDDLLFDFMYDRLTTKVNRS